MSPDSAHWQRLVLAAREIPGARKLSRFWYEAGIACFAWLAMYIGRKDEVVKAVYLRRGGSREELVSCASHLDFFLVLQNLSAEQELKFLKDFWRAYRVGRWIFPFFHEVLMGEETEFRTWLETPTVRSHEAFFSWRLLRGREFRGRPDLAWEPDPRNAYSEALKAYWEQLQAVIKLREVDFRKQLRPWQKGAVSLQQAAMATIDLFRLHHLSQLPIERRLLYWKASRLDLLTLLPAERYGRELQELRPLLLLEDPLFPDRAPLELFARLLHRSCLCLDELARALEGPGEKAAADLPWKLAVEEKAQQEALYSLSLRELFAERVLLRHPGVLSRSVLSVLTSHLYFLFDRVPPLAVFRELLSDLRDANFSFAQLRLAMPLSERAFRELERTPLLDSPFHAYASQRELRLGPGGSLVASPHLCPPASLSPAMLRQVFAELSFALRLPPDSLTDFLERTVNLVLSLRLATESQEIAASLPSALGSYRQRYPERAAHLEARLAPYFSHEEGSIQALWERLFASLREGELSGLTPSPALRRQLELVRANNARLAQSPTSATELWINLTPFLRMEMGAMREKYVRLRAPWKV